MRGWAKTLAILLGVAPMFGAHAALTWVGHATASPQNGFIEATDDIWINIEATPLGDPTGALVVYSTNNGATWSATNMQANGRIGLHDWWHVNLGAFPAGTTVRYAVQVFGTGGGSIWDNNGGSDYFVHVNGGAASRWIGNTRNDPPNQQVDAGENVAVLIESFPIGTATSARVVYSTNGGFSWSSVNMSKNGTTGANDLWQADIGTFPAGSTNLYAVEVTFGPDDKVWDTNNGANFPLIVNTPHAGQWVGRTRHAPQNGDIDAGEAITITTESHPLGKSISARALFSTDGTNWQEAALAASGTTTSNNIWSGSIGSFAAGAHVQYAVEVNFGYGGTTWDTSGGTNFLAIVNPAGPPAPWIGNIATYPAQGAITPEDDLWINAESRPAGESWNAVINWSTNGGATWTQTPMLPNGTNGINKLWHVNLGPFPAGTTNRFAIGVTFNGTNTIWENNGGSDYVATVNMPLHLKAIRNSYHYPSDADLDPGDTFYINTETHPIGAATNVRVVYTTDDGTNWLTANLSSNGVADGHTLWHVNLGTNFAAGTTIRYALEARDFYGASLWDNNWGEDFYVRVNSLIRDLYTDKSRYNPGDTAITSAELFNPSGSSINGILRLRVSHLFGELAVINSNITINAGQALAVNMPWNTPFDDFRGYSVDADFIVGSTTNDRRSTAIDVSTDWTKFPRYGFFSDYYPGESAADSQHKAKELSKYHINGVQFYDWMWEHGRLIPYASDGQMLDVFHQPIDDRDQSLVVVSNKIAAAKARNMFTMAYDLLYGESGPGSSPLHPQWAAYKQPWATAPVDIYQHPVGNNTIWVMDCTNPDWKRWIFNQFEDAMIKLGFEGIHLDNLGGAWNYKYNSNDGIWEGAGFPSFINDCRSALRTVNPNARVIHNDVYAGYLDQIAPSDADVYYAEVWGYDRYNDVRNLILRAKDVGHKPVVLAAYMNLDDYTNYLSEASVRLMDACVFANGAYHIELGEGVEMLSNHYFPMHWPPMRPTLKRAMRDYYDFIVKYENLLFFNTLGNVSDGTTGAAISSTTHALSKSGETEKIWSVVKLWRDEFDTISLINLHGVDELWRNRSARPVAQTQIAVKYYVDKAVTNVYVATPDDGLGRAMPLPFTEGIDGGGRYVEFTIPKLEYWDLVVLDKRSDVKVDGWPGDWVGSPPTNIHEVAVDRGEWIYKGDINDFRTFGGASPDEDITEVRITCDETYTYFLVRMQDITNPALPAIGIAWNSHLGTNGFPWIGDASTPSASIGLDHPDQHARREIMVYTAGGAPKIRLFNGGAWYVPNALDSAVAVSPEYDCVEFRINRHDLDLFYPQKVTVTLASFRSSGNEAGSDATFDSPDNNNDAVDVMGGDPGISANAWARDLDDNSIGRSYQILFNQQGADAAIQIAWPTFDGQRIDILSNEVYTVVARFSESLPAATEFFTFTVNGVTQNPSGYFIQDDQPGDLLNEARFSWTDTSTGIRTIAVAYAASGYRLSASRLVNLNPDTDGDGIRDALEDVNRNGIYNPPLETNYTNTDTDADGLADGFEDGNQDGRITGDLNNNYAHDPGEHWWETDPRNADTDGDGLPDGWEVSHGLDPWDDGVPGHTNMNTDTVILEEDDGANGDPDHDGVRNWDEWLAGTSPTDGRSFLGMQMPPDPSSTAGIIIQWQSVTGKWYTLDRATNLADPSAFTILKTNIAGQVNTTIVTDQTANGSGPYFYRVGTRP
ncbi:MAG: hypothetical protein M9963_03510 [Kiritimatiellae bacterium]|nr:hypothetical protein [Kiritimatiellia bacterium]